MLLSPEVVKFIEEESQVSQEIQEVFEEETKLSSTRSSKKPSMDAQEGDLS